MADEISRAVSNSAPASASLVERLRAALYHHAKSIHLPSRPGQSGATPTEPPVNFNAVRDTIYANPAHAVFANTLTVFTQEWVGIRSAAGSFPGRKMAIAKDAQIGPSALRQILETIEAHQIRVIVVHGLSGGVIRTAQALRIARPELRINAVWHGALAAWCLDEEREMARNLLELATTGVFDRVSFMKRGAHLLHRKAVPYLVPNMPPRVALKRVRLAGSGVKRSALFGSWNNAWKNMYSNVAAALLWRKLIKYFPTAPLAFHWINPKSSSALSMEIASHI